MADETKRVIIINEGTLKKSLNAPPDTPRPAAPKAQSVTTQSPQAATSSNNTEKKNG